MMKKSKVIVLVLSLMLVVQMLYVDNSLFAYAEAKKEKAPNENANAKAKENNEKKEDKKQESNNDAGSNDSGSSDAGSDDSGSSDSGSDDGGSSDAGSDDSGSSDAGSDDSGSSDAKENNGNSENNESKGTNEPKSSTDDSGKASPQLNDTGSFYDTDKSVTQYSGNDSNSSDEDFNNRVDGLTEYKVDGLTEGTYEVEPGVKITVKKETSIDVNGKEYETFSYTVEGGSASYVVAKGGNGFYLFDEDGPEGSGLYSPAPAISHITFYLSTGETPEGETPEGETPEGETPEGETPEGETPEGETPEGETPEGETPEGETPEGETPEGETPEGETVLIDDPENPLGNPNKKVKTDDLEVFVDEAAPLGAPRGKSPEALVAIDEDMVPLALPRTGGLFELEYATMLLGFAMLLAGILLQRKKQTV